MEGNQQPDPPPGGNPELPAGDLLREDTHRDELASATANDPATAELIDVAPADGLRDLANVAQATGLRDQANHQDDNEQEALVNQEGAGAADEEENARVRTRRQRKENPQANDNLSLSAVARANKHKRRQANSRSRSHDERRRDVPPVVDDEEDEVFFRHREPEVVIVNGESVANSINGNSVANVTDVNSVANGNARGAEEDPDRIEVAQATGAGGHDGADQDDFELGEEAALARLSSDSSAGKEDLQQRFDRTLSEVKDLNTLMRREKLTEDDFLVTAISVNKTASEACYLVAGCSFKIGNKDFPQLTLEDLEAYRKGVLVSRETIKRRHRELMRNKRGISDTSLAILKQELIMNRLLTQIMVKVTERYSDRAGLNLAEVETDDIESVRSMASCAAAYGRSRVSWEEWYELILDAERQNHLWEIGKIRGTEMDARMKALHCRVALLKKDISKWAHERTMAKLQKSRGTPVGRGPGVGQTRLTSILRTPTTANNSGITTTANHTGLSTTATIAVSTVANPTPTTSAPTTTTASAAANPSSRRNRNASREASEDRRRRLLSIERSRERLLQFVNESTALYNRIPQTPVASGNTANRGRRNRHSSTPTAAAGDMSIPTPNVTAFPPDTTRPPPVPRTNSGGRQLTIREDRNEFHSANTVADSATAAAAELPVQTRILQQLTNLSVRADVRNEELNETVRRTQEQLGLFIQGANRTATTQGERTNNVEVRERFNKVLFYDALPPPWIVQPRADMSSRDEMAIIREHTKSDNIRKFDGEEKFYFEWRREVIPLIHMANLSILQKFQCLKLMLVKGKSPTLDVFLKEADCSAQEYKRLIQHLEEFWGGKLRAYRWALDTLKSTRRVNFDDLESVSEVWANVETFVSFCTKNDMPERLSDSSTVADVYNKILKQEQVTTMNTWKDKGWLHGRSGTIFLLEEFLRGQRDALKKSNEQMGRTIKAPAKFPPAKGRGRGFFKSHDTGVSSLAKGQKKVAFLAEEKPLREEEEEETLEFFEDSEEATLAEGDEVEEDESCSFQPEDDEESKEIAEFYAHHGSGQVKVKKPSCSKCKKEHYLSSCPDLLAMSREQRLKYAVESKRCLNCLSTKHAAKQCTSKFRCKKCGSRHHTLLHKET